MRTSLLRLLAFALLLAMLLPLAVACGNSTGDDDTTTTPPETTVSPTTTVPATTAPTTTAPAVTTAPAATTAPAETTAPAVTTAAPAVTTAPVTTVPPVEIVTPEGATSNIELLTFTEIDAATLAGYTIVYADLASAEIVAAANALRDAIAEATGVTLEVKSDRVAFGESVPTDALEIRIGATNRDTGAALRYRNQSIYQDGASIVITGGGDEAVLAAVDAYTTMMLTSAVRVPTTEYYFHAKYQVEALYITGIDVSLFTIVRDAENAATAQYLQEYIRDLTGYVLPMALPTDPAARYEIIIGKMEPAGFQIPEAGYCLVEQIGSKLYLGGLGTHAGY